jgi:hypothetical protein
MSIECVDVPGAVGQHAAAYPRDLVTEIGSHARHLVQLATEQHPWRRRAVFRVTITLVRGCDLVDQRTSAGEVPIQRLGGGGCPTTETPVNELLDDVIGDRGRVHVDRPRSRPGNGKGQQKSDGRDGSGS